MEKIFEAFFTPQVLIFCLGIWILVSVQRKIVETFLPKLKNKKIWNDLLLPLGPIMTGGIVAFLAKKYPYPEIFNASHSGRIFFGIVCGGFSGYIYRIIKAFLLNKKEQFSKPSNQ